MSFTCNWDLFNKKLSGSGHSGVTDHISNLPECVLSRILSCLPTRDAVRTCVLSKVWEYRWTSIYNITVEDLDQVFFSGKRNDNASFMKFMERILLNSQNVRSFDILGCNETYDGNRVETWLAALFRCNVEFVYLHISGTEGTVVLPRSLLYCTSLRELIIYMFCTWKVPMKLCFPNLTRLDLQEVKILNDNPSTYTLIFTFPVLVTLDLRGCTWLKVKLVEFYAPCLSSFSTSPILPVNDYLIKICGAEVDEIMCYADHLENFLLTGSSVRYANLRVTGRLEVDVVRTGLRTRKLLTEFSCISELSLSCFTAQVIAQTKTGHHIPKFNKLGKLVLSGGTDLSNRIANIEALFEILHAAPFLNDLVMDLNDVRFEESEDGYDYESEVPSCIVSHLKTVKFNFFENKAHHVLRLAMYLLGHGAKLKTFSFSSCFMDEVELAKQISEFSKASTCVRIVID